MKQHVTSLVTISPAGKAKLADNTFWCIAPRDQPRTLDWAAGAAVTVEPTGCPIWQQAQNVDSGIEVGVAISEERF